MIASDPREARVVPSESILPVVARPSAGVPLGVIVGGVAVAAIALFAVLDNHRRQLAAPPAVATSDRAQLMAPPPPLDIPSGNDAQEDGYELYYRERPVRVVPFRRAWVGSATYGALAPPTSFPRNGARQTTPVVSSPPVGTATSAISVPNQLTYVPSPSGGRYEAAPAPLAEERRNNRATRVSSSANNRARAVMFENPATTIMQGTLIPAVLETGFDSSVPGFARAQVSRNVAGFDGTRIVVPRGSHLIGEYQSESNAGQRRALIVWSRLIRPDGATIELASPSTDPVGRGGIEAHVNRHFLQRFTTAALQTAVNIGSAVTGRSSSTAIVIAGPNASSTAAQLTPSDTIAPTLRVKPGTSVSVFVARDLDFTDIEQR